MKDDFAGLYPREYLINAVSVHVDDVRNSSIDVLRKLLKRRKASLLQIPQRSYQ